MGFLNVLLMNNLLYIKINSMSNIINVWKSNKIRGSSFQLQMVLYGGILCKSSDIHLVHLKWCCEPLVALKLSKYSNDIIKNNIT